MNRTIRQSFLLPVLLLAVLLFLPVCSAERHTAQAKTKLNKTSVDILKGHTYELKLKGASGTVRWKSSKKKVATVDADGIVTAKKAGRAKITAKAGGKKYTCTVTVYDAPNTNTEGALWGIDVSIYQKTINFKKAKKAGVDFVIIRAGHGDKADTKFASNYKKAKKAGLMVGCYWFITATSQDGIAKQAQKCLNTIRGKSFDLPVFVDIESYAQFNRGRDFCSMLVRSFNEAVKGAGYRQGWYTSRSFVNAYLSSQVINGYVSWVAEHSTKLRYGASCDLWQYSHTGRVNGVPTYVDLDWYFPNA